MKAQKRIWKIMAVVAVLGLLCAFSVQAAEETISGTVQTSDDGVIISTVDGQKYMVEGQDLSDMVGKNVKATGTLMEGDNGKTIMVTNVEEIAE